jgi:hypothetical protein
MVILEKCQVWTNYDEEILVTTFDCRLKGEIWIVLHSMELGPTVISDMGLITRIGFAAIPKFYTDNMSNLQKLIHYWFPIPILRSNFTISWWTLQSSMQNREIPSHPLSTLQPPPLPTHGWSLHTCAGGGSGSPLMRQVKEWIARATFSRKCRHPLLLSHLDVVLPPPATRLMYRFAVSSTAALPLSV